VRAAKAAKVKRPAKASAAATHAAALEPPPFRAVQLATLVDTVPAGDRWLHEMKYDGYRTLVSVGGGEARAYTRSGLDWSDRFPGILREAATLKARSALIDGEAVVLDANGKSSFQALQGALKGAPETIDYFAFDLLELDGEDLTRLPLVERKEKLNAILPAKSRHIRYSDHIQGDGEKLLNRFCEADLEGVISKLASAKYVGSRAGSWVKTKCIKRQEFVVVGWTLPTRAVHSGRSSSPSMVTGSSGTRARSEPASVRTSCFSSWRSWPRSSKRRRRWTPRAPRCMARTG
jgi:bifunctional non-homologous end joining protein LigD